MNILAQILGILAVAMYVSCYQLKTRRSIIFFSASSRVLYVAQYLLLGAFEGALLDTTGFFVSLLYRLRDRGVMRRYPTATVIFANAAIVALGMITYKNVYSLLPIFGVVFETLALWFKNERTIRIVSLISAPFWLVYNIISSAYGSAIGSVIAIVSITLAIVRYDLPKKADGGVALCGQSAEENAQKAPK